ncbi:sugar phosphate isomerase/epimerase [Streptomyces achromogenes]|uniref:Sugar phosphate isomerase/epimerase n=1 Tax=Streptomyces achromogenes TaxID=67255 RepID=A0ABU0Q520_STRAH|nr:sugar phosphate isomerase/epimerase [Streptomyces achromogenes]
MAEPVVRIPDAKVALSTASVYPESTATAFEIAARLGYDGVEVMVWNDPVSQDIDALRRLSDHHRVPILAVHAPCLLITQRVWSTDPWTKLQRARAAAEKLGASTVVVHPPFRWQRQYARDFVTGIWRMADETDVRFAVENMYPWRYRDREMLAYAPDWDVTKDDYRHFTIDLSHASTARADAMQMVDRMADRLGHVHLADGNGSAKDEHLVPGRGSQPCAELLERLALTGFDGHVVIEVNTRRAMSGAEREADLAEALAFTRLHLASASSASSVSLSPASASLPPPSSSKPSKPSTASSQESPAAAPPPESSSTPTGSSAPEGSSGAAMPSSRSSSPKSRAGFRRPKARRR